MDKNMFIINTIKSFSMLYVYTPFRAGIYIGEASSNHDHTKFNFFLPSQSEKISRRKLCNARKLHKDIINSTTKLQQIKTIQARASSKTL